MTELVRRDDADGVATLTLDSPHNRNALSRQLVTELFDHLEAAAADKATALSAALQATWLLTFVTSSRTTRASWKEPASRTMPRRWTW